MSAHEPGCCANFASRNSDEGFGEDPISQAPPRVLRGHRRKAGWQKPSRVGAAHREHGARTLKIQRGTSQCGTLRVRRVTGRPDPPHPRRLSLLLDVPLSHWNMSEGESPAPATDRLDVGAVAASGRACGSQAPSPPADAGVGIQGDRHPSLRSRPRQRATRRGCPVAGLLRDHHHPTG